MKYANMPATLPFCQLRLTGVSHGFCMMIKEHHAGMADVNRHSSVGILAHKSRQNEFKNVCMYMCGKEVLKWHCICMFVLIYPRGSPYLQGNGYIQVIKTKEKPFFVGISIFVMEVIMLHVFS